MEEVMTEVVRSLMAGGTDWKALLRRQIEDGVNSMLEAERTAFMGYEPYSRDDKKSDYRNGRYTRRMTTSFGDIEINVPRDRNGKFKQQTVPRYARKTKDLENAIILLYKSGVTTREISDLVEQLYGHRYSSTLVSNIAKTMADQIEAYHNRRLSKRYVAIYADTTYINVRKDAVEKEALHVLVGVTLEGIIEVVDYAIYPTEAASNYKEMLEDIKRRGAEEVLLFVTDGVNEMRDKILDVYPKADHQECWVHKVRSVEKKINASYKDDIAKELQGVYCAKDIETANEKLDRFCIRHRYSYPNVVKMFDDRRSLFSFMSYPEAICKSLYTTNIVENMNKQLKRKTKVKEQFPSVESLSKAAYCCYEDFNAKHNTSVYRGYDACQSELEAMFEEKYPEIETDRQGKSNETIITGSP